MEPCSVLVLGPIQVRTDDGPIAPGGAVSCAILAALVIGAGHAVPDDVLVDAAWQSQPPPDPEHSLHSQITRMRSILGREAVERARGSYALTVDPEAIDAVRFERLSGRARSCEDPSETRALCLEALDLWRGAPFGALADREFLQLESYRLEEIRLDVIETCFAADLDLGRHHEIVPALRAAVVQTPFRETLWEQLIIALDLSGRQPEALRAFDEYARFVRDELGISPGERLGTLRDAIVASRGPGQPTA